MPHLDIAPLVKPIHLIEKLEKNTLDFSVCSGLRIETLCRNGVDFVDEDDRRGVLPCQPEDVSNHAWTFAEILLDEFASDYTDEGGSCMMCDGFDQHRLSGALFKVF